MPTQTDQDETLYAGRDYTLRFTEVDAEDLSTFNEVTYAFAADENSTAEFTKTTSSGISITGSSNEVAEVSVDGTDTGNLSTPKDYYHELVTEDGNGKEQTAATGEVTLLPSVVDN